MSTVDPDALQQSAFFGEKMSTFVLQQQGQEEQSVKTDCCGDWQEPRAGRSRLIVQESQHL